jgi:hypothetical protein
LFPEACNELGPSIRNDGLGDTMQPNNLIKIDFGILLSRVSGMHRKKISRFSKSINNYPYGVMFLGRVRKTDNEIHTMSSHFHDGMGNGWSVPDAFR